MRRGAVGANEHEAPPSRPIAPLLSRQTPDGRTTTSCAGIWDDGQIEGHARITTIIERMGTVPAIQLGHTGRKGSELPPYRDTNSEGTWKQLPPDHPDGWTCVAPSAIPYGGGGHIYLVHQLSVEEINRLHQAYGGSLANRARFHLEALDAVRAVWPEKYPLTMRLGSDDLNPAGTQFDAAVVAIGMMKEHGLDLGDLSLGFNTDEMIDPPLNDVGFMIERAHRIRTEADIPIATS